MRGFPQLINLATVPPALQSPCRRRNGVLEVFEPILLDPPIRPKEEAYQMIFTSHRGKPNDAIQLDVVIFVGYV